MRRVVFLGLALAALSASAETIAFVNGRWFDGRRFERRTLYSVGGVFANRRPRTIDREIDLGGKFVVPPYGEAHNHNISDSPRVGALIARYIADGVFYVKNPGSLPRATKPLAGRINIPSSVDVIFSNGGLTCADGHPVEIVTPNRGFRPEDGEGAFYHVIDSAEDLEQKWPRILESKPDFIKVLLLYSEQYGEQRGPEHSGWKGLDPSLLPDVVKRAHAAGLRVSAHIETAADFRTALAAGVDEINHLPGFRPFHDNLREYLDGDRYRITPQDALAAKKRGATVVATVAPVVNEMRKPEADAAGSDAGREIIIHNLRTLRDGGVKLAVGSDLYGGTSRAEIDALNGLGVFTNLELLKMWSEITAMAIFPHRKIGRLAAGYEASFLVLEGDPLADFANTARIAMRVKQGQVIDSRK